MQSKKRRVLAGAMALTFAFGGQSMVENRADGRMYQTALAADGSGEGVDDGNKGRATNPAAVIFEGEEWYDQRDVYQVNREDAHTSFLSFDTVKKAANRNKEKSPYSLSLNGKWKFELADSPFERNEEFYKPEYSVKNWAQIKVPANWQTEGYDIPMYTDTRLPWEGIEMPLIGIAPTKYNPVGSYRRTFKTPKEWKGDEIFVSFQGVESAFYLWINGEKVGYSEDSYTASEFDISKYLKPAGQENVIAVQVYRWSDESYLEDQDFIRLSGIFRDVFLFAKNKSASLFDFNYTTDFDENYKDATITMEAALKRYSTSGKSKGQKVNAILLDAKGKQVFKKAMVSEILRIIGQFMINIPIFKVDLSGIGSTSLWNGRHQWIKF